MNLDLVAIIGTVVAFATCVIWQLRIISRSIVELTSRMVAITDHLAEVVEDVRTSQSRDHETLRERQVHMRGIIDGIARDVGKLRNGRD